MIILIDEIDGLLPIFQPYYFLSDNMDKQQIERQVGHRQQGKLSKENVAVGQLHDQLNKLFVLMMEDIRTDQKMHQYLKKINIPEAELLNSFNKIIDSNRLLLQKSLNHDIIRHSAKTYFQFLINFFKSKDHRQLDPKGRIVWYLQIQTKLQCCLDYFHSLKLEKDITNSPKQDYPQVWARITVQKVGDLKTLQKEYKALKKMMHIATSATIKEEEHDFSLVKKIKFGLSFSKYFIMNDSAKLKSFVFYRNPTLQMAQKIWNIPDLGATKEFTKIAYEGIKTNIKIYIPFDGEYKKGLDIFEKREDAIKVRVLCNRKLVPYPQFQKGGCMTKTEVEYHEKIMVHMHGGGFVALSSRSMQNHTRKWANELGIPIFSIDYRMPPKHPFPQAPKDCYAAYQFITNHIHNYLNVRPNAVYLAGDSAGGNLACSLTSLILRFKAHIPRGIYLAYPAADLRYQFTTSRLHAITDPMLWPSMLLLCLSSYMNNDFTQADSPLASPVLLTEQDIGGEAGNTRFPLNWPKTIITVGNKDPLYDDSLILMQRMVQSKVDCQCIIYDQLSHAYLSSDLFIKECAKTLTQSIQHLKKLINA